MRATQKEAILISFLNEKEQYKRLADYIVHLVRDDPAAPKKYLHTIIYRVKDEIRLIEKIDKLNSGRETGEPPITDKNYRKLVGDLLGVRIICLRLSDIVQIEAYLGLLSEEKILRFTKEPDHKRSFILPFSPGASIPDEINLTYNGYSSIHYQVTLGNDSDAPAGLRNLQFEIQLRTILEEAWGEIDHKYRYVHSRRGVALPESIHTGFYNFSAYLQVAALQAEHLCRLTEDYHLKKTGQDKKKMTRTSLIESGPVEEDVQVTSQEQSATAIAAYLEESLGFKVTARTLTYIERRLAEIGLPEDPSITLENILTQNRVLEFEAHFRDIVHREPFSDEKERNIDVINALNFAIFDELQGKRVAQEGLRSVLRWRKERVKS
jgi:putative GTP pyrophosphokinase